MIQMAYSSSHSNGFEVLHCRNYEYTILCVLPSLLQLESVRNVCYVCTLA